MFKKTIRAVKKISFHIQGDEKTKKRNAAVSLLPTLCPIWTSPQAINYSLKYTVEGLSAGLRPGGGGKGKTV